MALKNVSQFYEPEVANGSQTLAYAYNVHFGFYDLHWKGSRFRNKFDLLETISTF